MNTKAFTLVETLVAVSIVTLAVTGPLVTASRTIVAAEIANDQITASYLAQEGIEYVRAMRDDAYLKSYRDTPNPALVSSNAWNWFITGNESFSVLSCLNATCTLDTTENMGTTQDASTPYSITPCSGNTCTQLYMTSVGTYSQNSTGNTPTGFTRTIEVNTVPPDDFEKVVVSKVTWDFHGTLHTVTIMDHITRWQ